MEYLRRSSMSPEKGYFDSDREETEGKLDEAVRESQGLIVRQQEILDRVCSPETDSESREIITARVFEHSVADGLKLAERMQYGSRDYFELLSRPQFYLKHGLLAKEVLREAAVNAQNETDKKRIEKLRETYATYDDMLEAGKFDTFLKEEKPKGLPAKELLDEVDEWYSQFLKTRSLTAEQTDNDPRSKGEQLGEKLAEQIKLALEKNYYAGSVMEIVAKHLASADAEKFKKGANEIFSGSPVLQEKYKHTGFDAYFENVKKGTESARALALENLSGVLSEKELEIIEWSSYVPNEIAQKIFSAYKISDQSSLKQLENARYEPLGITFRAQASAAEKELIKEITENGGRIIWNEKDKKYEVKGNKPEKNKTKYLTEEKILDKLEELLEIGENLNLDDVAEGLAGLDSDRAWQMRQTLINAGLNSAFLLNSLAGCDSNRAWILREGFLPTGEFNNSLLESLIGIDSDHAWNMREKLIKSGGVSKPYMKMVSLNGLDSKRAWDMRDELIKKGLDREYILQSIAGCDSERAWDMRDELIKKGYGHVLQSLAGLDSDRAWKIREEFIGKRAFRDSLTLSLASLDSDRAWKLRETIKEGAFIPDYLSESLAGLDSKRAWDMRDYLAGIIHKSYIAPSLNGVNTFFIWQLRKKEAQIPKEIERTLKLLNILNELVPVQIEVEETERQPEKNETKYLTEEKILDKLEELMKAGVNKVHIAEGLTGLDSDRAWNMRNELSKAGGGSGYIIQSLAGCDSNRAWDLRDGFMKSGAFNSSLLMSLVGLDSARAWTMREELIKSGVHKGSLAQGGLAGLDSARAWKMREELIKSGVGKGYIAEGLAGCDSERAWTMREEFIKSGVDEVSIAEGLVGLDSARAWKMREELIKSGVGKGYIARGLVGLDSVLARTMREEFIKSGVDKVSIAIGLAGCDSVLARLMREKLIKAGRSDVVPVSLAGNYKTFIWQLLKKEETKDIAYKITNAGTGEFDEKALAGEISEYMSRDSLLAEKNNQTPEEKMRSWLQTGTNAARTISTVLKESPRIFLNTMAAKKDVKNIVQKFEYKAFPSVLSKQKESAWRDFPGYFGYGGGGSEKYREPSPEDYLNPDSMEKMLGGDPEGGEGGRENEEVMRFREPVKDLVVTGIYGKFSGQVWDPSYQFKIAKKPKEEAKEISIVLPHVGAKTKLPKLVGSDIITERVKGMKNKEEVPLEAEISPMGEGLVLNTKKVHEVVYSIEIDEVPPALRQISKPDYARFREQLVRADDASMITELMPLPEEIDLFLMSIKDREPKEQVQAIEQFVRSISFYDMKNGEMIGLKRGKSLEERLEIMEARVDELKEKEKTNKEALAGKKYAGVCADFAVLSTAILRKAGFASGVLSGFMPEGTVAKVKDAHATAFVVWPDGRGGNEIFAVDGTPSGLEGISRPSLEELEKIRGEKTKEIRENGEKQLDEIMKMLANNDEESISKLTNGTLEKVLNAVLRYEVKQENVQAVTGMLEAYWYSPLHKLDLKKTGETAKFLEFFESEVARSRNMPAAEVYADPGSKLFETVEAFLQRFGKESDINHGIETMKDLVDAIGNKINKTERKALVAITTYLQAKKMTGKDK